VNDEKRGNVDALLIIISKFSVALRKIGSPFDDERRIFI
jgi:hypothetical protein